MNRTNNNFEKTKLLISALINNGVDLVDIVQRVYFPDTLLSVYYASNEKRIIEFSTVKMDGDKSVELEYYKTIQISDVANHINFIKASNSDFMVFLNISQELYFSSNLMEFGNLYIAYITT